MAGLYKSKPKDEQCVILHYKKDEQKASMSKNYKNISNEQIDSALLFQYD